MSNSAASRWLAPLVVAVSLSACSSPATPVGTAFHSEDYTKRFKSPLLERLAAQTPEARSTALPLGDDKDAEVKITINHVTDPETHVIYFKDVSYEVTRNKRFHFVGGGFFSPLNRGTDEHPDFGSQLSIVYDWTTTFGTSRVRTASLTLKADGTVTEDRR